MYHTVAHQAGLIVATGHGDVSVSARLRQLAVVAMRQHPGICEEDEHPGIREEDDLNLAQRQGKSALIQYPAHWSGDLELRVALGLGKDIIVLSENGPHQPPLLSKMNGCIFINWISTLCAQHGWHLLLLNDLY